MASLLTEGIEAGWALLRHNLTDFQLYVCATLAFHLAVFWPVTLLYMLIDLAKPAFLFKYKIQKTRVAGWEQYKKAIHRAIVSQVVGIGLQCTLFSLQEATGYGIRFSQELPSLFTVAWHLPVFMLVEEIGFFYSHWLFHHPFFYAPIHKFHHEFKAPVAMACIYAHPLEHIVANLLPLVLGPTLVQAHITELWLWLTIGILSTMNGHSGYQFPGFPDAFTHDYHHEAFNYNFGALGLCDWLHGTNGKRKGGMDSMDKVAATAAAKKRQ